MAIQTRYRELSAAEILSRSFGLYFVRFEYLLAPFLITNLANGAMGQLMDFFMPDFNFPSDFSEEYFLWLIDYVVVAVPLAAAFAVIGWVISTLSSGIVVKYSSDLLEGRRASLKKGLNSALSMIFPLLTTGVVIGVLIILGLILFVIPGIIVAVMFSVTVQTIVVEELDTSKSLSRSRRLAANRWGKTFAVLLSIFVITAVTYVVGDVVADAAGGISGGFLGIPKWFIRSIITSIAQPLHPIALTYLYYSLRTREEVTEPRIRVQPPVQVSPPATRQPPQTLRGLQPSFCYKCGQRLPPDALYCPRCGVYVKPW